MNIHYSIRWLFASFTASILLSGCGGSSGGAPTPPPTPTTPPPASPPPPPPARLTDPIEDVVEVGTISVDAVQFVQGPGTEDRESRGGVNNPATRIQYMRQVGERFFFNDTRGVLWVTDSEGSAPTSYLDLRNENVGFNADAFVQESGFMGFAFHPDFANEGEEGFGKFYTTFSASPDGTADFIEESASVQESVLAEWSVADPTSDVFTGEFREMLRVGQFAPNHNVGNVAFNPTANVGDADYGMLYVSFGDGGSAHDPREHGQNPNSILGTIVRIDPLGGGDDAEYGIPADNPFADGADGLPEVWAYGLRHPQNYSWDTADGRMFILDIGQDQIEEVNIGVAGGNYGWRLREGTFATAHGVDTNDSPGGVYERETDSADLIYPVAQYDHDEGFAIGSGFVYRGSGIPDLVGMFVFTEIVRGRLFYIDTSALEPDSPTTIYEFDLTIDGESGSLADIAGHRNTSAGHAPYTQRVDLRVSTDAAGELYILSKGDGWIRKLTPR
ncbi:MAG: PQQ-dependent sugar dehydrogenase [Gammaproteobacteria bacterium]|nr:PQQ-dependent sugar dehydrogenase [Gammaproteobacteria bacterium]